LAGSDSPTVRLPSCDHEQRRAKRGTFVAWQRHGQVEVDYGNVFTQEAGTFGAGGHGTCLSPALMRSSEIGKDVGAPLMPFVERRDPFCIVRKQALKRQHVM
jgi:hypothetical protein